MKGLGLLKTWGPFQLQETWKGFSRGVIGALHLGMY